jgi:hypothetical protein
MNAGIAPGHVNGDNRTNSIYHNDMAQVERVSANLSR